MRETIVVDRSGEKECCHWWENVEESVVVNGTQVKCCCEWE